MRIAIDATYTVDPHPSGIAAYSRQLIDGLARLHWKDQFLHCYRPKQWQHRLPLNHSNTASRMLQWPLPLGRADLFHALNQRVDWRPARRVVSTFHDLFVMTAEYSTPEFRKRFAEQARRAAERSDAIIAVSQFTAEQVHSLLEVERSLIHVIRHGVHLPAERADDRRENMILSVGALQIRKNTARLVEAFEKLEQSDWRLVLAGAPTGYGAQATLEAIEKSSAKERIEVAGYVSSSELETLYRQASIFAFVSLDEGFGIPVLEAMAHGVPVITSKRPALEEVAGKAAIMVDPTQTDDIVRALQKLVADVDLRDELRESGRRRAMEFSWEGCVEETYKLYKQLAR